MQVKRVVLSVDAQQLLAVNRVDREIDRPGRRGRIGRPFAEQDHRVAFTIPEGPAARKTVGRHVAAHDGAGQGSGLADRHRPGGRAAGVLTGGDQQRIQGLPIDPAPLPAAGPGRGAAARSRAHVGLAHLHHAADHRGRAADLNGHVQVQEQLLLEHELLRRRRGLGRHRSIATTVVIAATRNHQQSRCQHARPDPPSFLREQHRIPPCLDERHPRAAAHTMHLLRSRLRSDARHA